MTGSGSHPLGRLVAGVAFAVLASSVSPAFAASDVSVKLVNEGRAQLQKGDVKGATIQFKKAIKEDPNNADARFHLGMTEYVTRDYVAAEKEFEMALDRGYAQDKALPMVAWTLLYQGKVERLLKTIRPCPGDGTCKAEVLAARARANLIQKDVKQADADSKSALDAEPSNVQARLARAQVLASQGDYGAAEQLADGLIAENPKQSEALSIKGDMRRQAADLAAAAASYRKSVEFDSSNAYVHSQLAVTLMALNKTAEAQAEVNKALVVAPKSVKALYLKALLLTRSDKMGEALDVVRPIEAELSKEPAGLFLLGVVHAGNNNPEEALAYAQRFHALAPENLPGTKLVATISYRLGNYDRAVSLLEPLRSKLATDPEALDVLGSAYLAEGKVKEANDVLSEAIKIRPDAGDVRGRRALAQMRQTETREAGIHELEELVTRNPDKGQFGVALVSSLFGAGDYGRAIAEADAMIARTPSNPVIYVLRGSSRLARGDEAGARADFRLALDKDPGFVPAALNLAELDIRASKFDVARTTIDKILDLKPSDLRALMARAKIENRANNLAGVTQFLERAISSHPEELEPRAMLINAHVKAGSAAKAVLAASDLARTLPHNPMAVDVAAQNLLDLGKADEALAVLKRLQAEFSDIAQVHLRLGQVYTRLNRLPEAVAALDRAISANSTYIPAWSDRVAVELQTKGLDAALALAEKAQKANHNNVIARLITGDLYVRSQRWADAQDSYRKVAEEFDSSLATNRYFHSTVSGGDRAKARKILHDWLAKHPDDLLNEIAWADDLFAAGELKAAAAAYEKVAVKTPRDANLFNNMAIVYDRLDNPKAIEAAKYAVSLAPANPSMLDTYGYILYRKGDKVQAANIIRQAFEAQPRDPSIAYHHARVLADRGEVPQAKGILKALSAAPFDFDEKAEAQQLYAKLGGGAS